MFYTTKYDHHTWLPRIFLSHRYRVSSPRLEEWNLHILSLITCSFIFWSQNILSSRPTLLFFFEFPLIHTVDVGMGKDHSVCRKVVTDTGCVYRWSQIFVRCIPCHECQRFVECDPQFDLENSMIIHFFSNMTPCILVAYYRWIGNHLPMVTASHYRILELLSIPLMQDEISTVVFYSSLRNL
jgi:hypothetical protein